MDTDKDVEQEESRGVGKGAKLGLALIGLLVLVLIGVVLVKLRAPGDKAVASNARNSARGLDVGGANKGADDAGQAWGKQRRGLSPPANPTVVPLKPEASRSSETKTPSRWSLGSGGTSPDMSMMPVRSTGSSSAGDVSVLPAPRPRADNGSWQQPQQPTSGVPSDAFTQQQRPATGAYAQQQPAGGAYSQPQPLAATPAYPSYYPASNPQYSNGSSYPSYTPYPTASSSGSAGTEPNPLRGREGGQYHADHRSRESRWGRDNGYSQEQTYRPSGTNASAGQHGYETAPYMQKAAKPYDDPYAIRPLGAGSSLGGRREDGKYVIGPNENLCTISERLYGTDAYFKALAEVNRAKFPDENRLRVGDAIVAPEESELIAKYPDLCPSPERREVIRSRVSAVSTRSQQYGSGPTYTVQHGDTLFDIAQFKLGSGTRWPEIYDLNADVLQSDFNYVTPGMRLALPGESSDEVTQRPGSSRNRQ